MAEPTAVTTTLSLEEALEIVHEGGVFLKWPYSGKGKPKARIFYCQNANQLGGIVLYGEPGKKSKPDKLKRMQLSVITRVTSGKRTSALKSFKEAKSKLCFSVVGSARTLDFQADNEAARDRFVLALHTVLAQEIFSGPSAAPSVINQTKSPRNIEVAPLAVAKSVKDKAEAGRSKQGRRFSGDAETLAFGFDALEIRARDRAVSQAKTHRRTGSDGAASGVKASGGTPKVLQNSKFAHLQKQGIPLMGIMGGGPPRKPKLSTGSASGSSAGASGSASAGPRAGGGAGVKLPGLGLGKLAAAAGAARKSTGTGSKSPDKKSLLKPVSPDTSKSRSSSSSSTSIAAAAASLKPTPKKPAKSPTSKSGGRGLFGFLRRDSSKGTGPKPSTKSSTAVSELPATETPEVKHAALDRAAMPSRRAPSSRGGARSKTGRRPPTRRKFQAQNTATTTHVAKVSATSTAKKPIPASSGDQARSSGASAVRPKPAGSGTGTAALAGAVAAKAALKPSEASGAKTKTKVVAKPEAPAPKKDAKAEESGAASLGAARAALKKPSAGGATKAEVKIPEKATAASEAEPKASSAAPSTPTKAGAGTASLGSAVAAKEALKTPASSTAAQEPKPDMKSPEKSPLIAPKAAVDSRKDSQASTASRASESKTESPARGSTASDVSSKELRAPSGEAPKPKLADLMAAFGGKAQPGARVSSGAIPATRAKADSEKKASVDEPGVAPADSK